MVITGRMLHVRVLVCVVSQSIFCCFCAKESGE